MELPSSQKPFATILKKCFYHKQFWKLRSKAFKYFIRFKISSVIRMSFACHLYVTCIYSCVMRMSLVCTCVTFVCHLHVLVCHPYVARILVCRSYVLVCHPYVTCMYSYVIRMSLVCTRMSSVYNSYVILMSIVL